MAKAQDTTKKTTSKATSTKKVAKEVANKKTSKETVSEKVIDESVNKKVEKTFKDDDYIQCRNIFVGETLFFGAKSGNTYKFAGQDDTYGVEVRDLNSLLASKSRIIFRPFIVIEDEDFISQPRWKEIKEMYELAKIADINELIDKPIGDFKIILERLPKGYKDLLVEVISSRLQEGTFDSLAKIKATDEICGSELILLAN